MNRLLIPWLLAGALGASLTWNWRLTRSSNDAAPECASECAPIAAATLGLDVEQEAALDRLCRESCVSADRLEREAAERERALMNRLAAGELDEAQALELALEVGALRNRSLEACVRGILAVREVLTPAQVTSLVSQCAANGTCAK
jgi:Spy/CpxP family protein refolding chaperone